MADRPAGPYLLDTFALIALLSAPDRMRSDARDALDRDGAVVAFSPASIWEIGIKVALGKLPRPSGHPIHAARALGLRDLPVTAEHAMAAGQLPPHHRDPFDRLLIAQAHVEGLTVVTPDAVFPDYGIRVLAC